MPSINDISFAGLARRLGVPRQRIYNLHKAGKIHAYLAGGQSLVIPAGEADRIIAAAVTVKTANGTRIVFNFI